MGQGCPGAQETNFVQGQLPRAVAPHRHVLQRNGQQIWTQRGSVDGAGVSTHASVQLDLFLTHEKGLELCLRQRKTIHNMRHVCRAEFSGVPRVRRWPRGLTVGEIIGSEFAFTTC